MFILNSFYLSRESDADKWLFLMDFVSLINETNEEDDIINLLQPMSNVIRGKIMTEY